MIDFHPDNLTKRLCDDLPGREAQERMAPSVRYSGQERPDPSSAKESAVLITIFPFEGAWGTILIERSEIGPHAGQISFPGGKRDPEDHSAADTALREANEEIGIKREDVCLAGQLTKLYVPNSNFWITPFIGWINEEPVLTANPAEVKSIILVRLDQLLGSTTKKRKIIKRNGFHIDAPYYDIDGYFIWGATAMIISEFEAILT